MPGPSVLIHSGGLHFPDFADGALRVASLLIRLWGSSGSSPRKAPAAALSPPPLSPPLLLAAVMSMRRQSPEEAATLEADAFTAPATSVLLAVSLATAAESTTLITSRFALPAARKGGAWRTLVACVACSTGRCHGRLF